MLFKIVETKTGATKSDWGIEPIVGIDASQFYSFFQDKKIATGPYTKRKYKEDTEKLLSQKTWRSYSEHQVMQFF